MCVNRGHHVHMGAPGLLHDYLKRQAWREALTRNLCFEICLWLGNRSRPDRNRCQCQVTLLPVAMGFMYAQAGNALGAVRSFTSPLAGRES